MAKITLELTDTIISVSGPSSFLPLNKEVGSSSKQFKIVLDTETATADLSKIGTAADNTTLVFYKQSTDYNAVFNNKGFVEFRDKADNHVVATLPIAKADGSSALTKLHFADYATDVSVIKHVVGTGSKAVTTFTLDHAPDLLSTVTLSSIAATVNEGSAVTYTATLDKAALTDLNISYTLGGNATAVTDYTTTSTGTIKIAAGALTGTLVLTAVPDAKTEGAETVSVTLVAANVKLGTTTAITTTINDTSTGPINISATLLTGTATTAADVFNFASGNYTATIAGFNNGDKLTFFSGASVSMLSDANNADKTQQFQIDDPATNSTAIITLTGLTDAQDAALFTKASFDLVFGTGTLA